MPSSDHSILCFVEVTRGALTVSADDDEAQDMAGKDREDKMASCEESMHGFVFPQITLSKDSLH